MLLSFEKVTMKLRNQNSPPPPPKKKKKKKNETVLEMVYEREKKTKVLMREWRYQLLRQKRGWTRQRIRMDILLYYILRQINITILQRFWDFFLQNSVKLTVYLSEMYWSINIQGNTYNGREQNDKGKTYTKAVCFFIFERILKTKSERFRYV